MGRRLALGLLVGLMWQSVAYAQESVPAELADIGQRLDIVWMLVAAAMVFMMQIGFLLLEAGMVRSKNSINVAQKNLLDFLFSVIVFAGFGFMLAFGASSGVLPFGFDPGLLALNGLDAWTIAFFVFQVMFCGTAATIVSGAVAERMKLLAYVLGTVFLAGLVYPVFVHWAWGSALGPSEGAFLANLGFIDFAGSTVVHATGGWVALAACLVLGPRLGRFDPAGKPVRIAGHSPVLAASGGLLLFFGWFGFNGGSTVAASTDIAPIIANTLLAGAAGGAVGYLFGWAQDRTILPDRAVSGLLGGLVAVTAGCLVLTPSGATLVGLLGGFIATIGNHWLERARLDDAVGAIGVHAFAGVFGTLALALLAPPENLTLGSPLEQLAIQALGVGVNFAWAFGLGLMFFFAMDRLLPIRVSPRDEETGLNEAEHATRLGIGHVEEAFSALAQGRADLSTRLKVDSGDEAEVLTRIFNDLMDQIERGEIDKLRADEERRTDEEAERLTALADATFEGICITESGRIVDGNGALETLLGCTIEQIKGNLLADYVAPERKAMFSTHLAEHAGAPAEIDIVNAEGDVIPVELRCREIIYRGARTQVIAMVDLRERRKAEERIRFLAQHDPLTNLPNRALFNERLTGMIRRTIATGVSSAVVLIDLDRFKDINDLYGHPAGDEVIKVTAQRLLRAVRPGDMVARLGGDEFAVLQMEVAFASQADDLVMRLLNELSAPIDVGKGVTVRPTASIGVAICPRDGLQGEQLVSRADTALYHAKNRGRNVFAVFESGMDDEVRRRQAVEAELDPAIAGKQFSLHFQPRLDVASGTIRGYEALIRWEHPEKGLIGPNEFIPVAESTGKIVPIGAWVLDVACRTAARWPERQKVSVNVSPVQFSDRAFTDTVRNVLEESGLEPDRLEIEITESVLIGDDRRALAILNDIKELGVHVALDDFGTGYSSLGYLSRFPFDTIKIDQTFVRALGEDSNNIAIVDTIIRLGRALEMELVAEGVESLAVLGMLAEKGCNEIQGYIVGRPEPLARLQARAPEQVLELLAEVRSTAENGDVLRDLARRMRDGEGPVKGGHREAV